MVPLALFTQLNLINNGLYNPQHLFPVSPNLATPYVRGAHISSVQRQIFRYARSR